MALVKSVLGALSNSNVAAKAALLVLATTAAACNSHGDGSPSRPTVTAALTTSSVTDRYIVVFKKGAAQAGIAGRAVADVAASLQRSYGGQVMRTYQHALNGMAARLSPAQVASLQADSRVAYVEADGVMRINDTQTNATWGLDRIDQRPLPLDSTYVYPTQAGEAVHAYIIDTGVFAGHSEFATSGGGSRVIPGFDFIDNDANPDDCNGHGTHVSGTVGGTTWGVAKKVTLHSVRVLDCGGSGTFEGVIAGIDWVTANTLKPAVANMSLGGAFSQAVNDAVTNSIASGVTYGIAAGNNAGDACANSPASTPNAITVGATNITDNRSSFSNFGTCLDIFAPGEQITSSWMGSPTATNTISGTSMATPHVVGTAALWLSLHPASTPAEVAQVLGARSTPNLVVNPGTGSPNALLYMAGMTGGGTPPKVFSITVSPSTLEGGTTATGTVLLTEFAPTGGVTVALASANTSLVTVPATVVVPASALSATFPVTTMSASSQTPVQLTATFPATDSVTTTITLLGSPTVTSLSLSPNTVPGGTPSTATITLSGPTPAGGSVVALASSNTAAATVPATVSIPQGATGGTFTVTTLAQNVTLSTTISAALNGLTRTATLTVTKVLPVGNATFDTALRAPRCLTVNSFCDSGGLIDGRATIGPEANTPNTINNSCLDGTTGFYHSDESLDRLKVSTVDGTPLAAGKTVTIETTVWVWGSASDFLDLFFAPDANNPVWTPIATLTAVTTQLQVLSTTFVLPAATLPAIRGNWRFVGSQAPCTAGVFDDRDDLVFAIGGSTPPTNTAPVVNAGGDQAITLPALANLSGSATDDGLPNPPAILTTTWSAVSGPGTVTFGNTAALATTATFSAAGSYILRLTASDGALSTSDDVGVTVSPAPVNQAPVVNAGPDQTITLPAGVTLAGTVTDDGLPNPPAAVTTTWAKVSGPGTVTFANPASGNTTATFSLAGSYVLSLTASDSVLSASDSIAVTVNAAATNQAPVVNAGPDQTITLPSTATVAGTVTDDGLPNPPAAVTTTWTKVSGPGTVTFGNAANRNTTATFSLAGSYVLRLTASDSVLSANDTITVTVNAAAAASLKVQYRVAETAVNDNHIRPRLIVVNTGGTAVPLSELKIRYWYTIDTQQPQTSWCDWAQIGCDKLTRTFVTVSPTRTGADRYLEVGFTAAAGSLAAGASTGEMQLRFNKNDWSNFNEANDHSYSTNSTTPAPMTFVDWTRATLYRNGTRIWGTEP